MFFGDVYKMEVGIYDLKKETWDELVLLAKYLCFGLCVPQKNVSLMNRVC